MGKLPAGREHTFLYVSVCACVCVWVMCLHMWREFMHQQTHRQPWIRLQIQIQSKMESQGKRRSANDEGGGSFLVSWSFCSLIWGGDGAEAEAERHCWAQVAHNWNIKRLDTNSQRPKAPSTSAPFCTAHFYIVRGQRKETIVCKKMQAEDPTHSIYIYKCIYPHVCMCVYMVAQNVCDLWCCCCCFERFVVNWRVPNRTFEYGSCDWLKRQDLLGGLRERVESK